MPSPPLARSRSGQELNYHQHRSSPIADARRLQNASSPTSFAAAPAPAASGSSASAMATPGVAPPPSGGCTLRIFHVNDVYELDNLPRLKRAIETLRTGNDVALLAGDFVSPSLLSSRSCCTAAHAALTDGRTFIATRCWKGTIRPRNTVYLKSNS